LGVTASPARTDGRGLGIASGGVFDCMVEGPQACDLTADGYIKPIRVFAPATSPDLSGIKLRGGDYEKGALAEIMGKPTITGCAIDHYARLCPGWPAVAFCVSVQHAKDTAASFRASGWRSVAAYGDMSQEDRDAALGGLVTGEVQVLAVCDLISEGLDIPGIAAVIFLRATRSLINLVQWTGRGTRPVYAPGFDLSTTEGRKAAIAASKYPCCFVLDHAGVTLSLGMPDEKREWSLEGRPKRESAPPVKQCPSCFCVHSPVNACPECGHSYEAEIKAAREIEIVAGQLEEINAQKIAAIRQTPLANLLTGRETREQLEEIRKAKKYHPRWTFHVLNERRRVRSAAA
jgi:DNA repair protein RadD